MIQITGLQLLYKEEGIYESIVGSKTRIILVANQTDTYESKSEKSHNRLIKWPVDALPNIPVGDNLSNFQLDFKFMKGSQLMGSARSFMLLGHNRKDCLDVVNDKFEIIGKFLYEGKWIYGYSQRQYSFQPQPFQKQIVKEELQPQYPKIEDVKTEQTEIKRKRQDDDEEGFFSGLLSCCTTKRRPKKKRMQLKAFNTVVDYHENQLQGVQETILYPLPFQHYSKRIFISQ